MKIPHTRGVLPFVIGAACGAVAAYFYDPDRGRARRAMVRDQVRSESRTVRRALRRTARHVENRLAGLPHRLGSRFKRDSVLDDLQLIEQVRSRMGHLVSNPGALQVGALEGEVTLSGPILSVDYETLIELVRDMPGVYEVHDQLAVYDSTDGIPALQGSHMDDIAR